MRGCRRSTGRAVASAIDAAVIRPLGDVVVLMPPLAMSADEISHLVQITAASIAEATARPVLRRQPRMAVVF